MFQYFTSLVFLPIKYVSFGLEYIKSIKPIISTKITEKLIQFEKYFDYTYGFVGLYPPSKWNHFKTTKPRTTNHVECGNKHLAAVTGYHPTEYAFGDSIKPFIIEFN